MLKLFPPNPKRRTPFWTIRGTLYGQVIDASTKERDKARARKFKEQLEVKLAHSLNKPHTVATFGEAARLYVEFRKPARPDLMAIEGLTKVIGDTVLSEVRQHHLVSAAELLRPNAGPETRNRMVITPASSILHYAADNNLCPYIRVKKFKEKRPEPRSLSREDAAKLIGASTGQLRSIITFLFCQGWRVSDALRLQWQDINFQEGTARYHVSKTDEWLVMPLHARVLAILAPGRLDLGRVFHWGDKANLYRELRPFCKKVGIFFTPHMARHSFATWLAADGVSTKEIMEAGAWKDHKSVMRYTKVDAVRTRNVINKIKA